MRVCSYVSACACVCRYGSDCLDHSIDKYHGNAEADVKEKDTDQSGAPKK